MNNFFGIFTSQEAVVSHWVMVMVVCGKKGWIEVCIS